MSSTGVVIVSHGDAAVAMVQAAQNVVGDLGVHTVIVGSGEPNAETEKHIERELDDIETDDLLFLVDLEGATPSNLCCKRCKGTSVVLSGMNLPMLFKLATADRSKGAMALAEELM